MCLGFLKKKKDDTEKLSSIPFLSMCLERTAASVFLDLRNYLEGVVIFQLELKVSHPSFKIHHSIFCVFLHKIFCLILCFITWTVDNCFVHLHNFLEVKVSRVICICKFEAAQGNITTGVFGRQSSNRIDGQVNVL